MRSLFHCDPASRSACRRQRGAQRLDTATRPACRTRLMLRPAAASVRSTPSRRRNGAIPAETLCAQSRYAEAEKLYVKLLEEREHALGLNSPELVVRPERSGPGDVRANEISAGAHLLRPRVADHGDVQGPAGSSAVVAPLDKLAKVYQTLEKYPAAEQYVRRAVAVVGEEPGTGCRRTGAAI